MPTTLHRSNLSLQQGRTGRLGQRPKSGSIWKLPTKVRAREARLEKHTRPIWSCILELGGAMLNPATHALLNAETAYSAPQRPGRQRHSQHRPRNKLQVPVSSAAAFPAFNPNTQMQNQIYVHPSFSSAAWTSSMNQMRAFPASFNSDRCHAFPHHPCPPACPSTTHVAASCSVSTEPSSDVLSGPFPSAASQLHPPAVTTHDSSMQLSAAAPSSCPTESSQASEMSVPQAPQSSTRQTHASQNAQQSAQTAHSAAFHTSSSSHQTRGLALPPQSPYEHTVSALSACTLHNSPHNTGRDNSGTPSCSTESSSEAGDAAIKVCVQTPGNVQKVQHEATAPSPHVAVKPWARVGNSSAAHGSISGSSIATESSVSVQSVKASQPQAAPGFGARSRSHRCSAKARPTGAAGCGHAAAARESQRTNFASSSSHSGLHRPAGLRPGQSIGTPAVGDAPEWSTALNTPQTPFRCATDGVVRLGGIPCLPHVAGAKASGRSSSGGSYESSSRPSFSGAGGIRVSSVERLDDASSHHESRSQHMLGGKLSAAAGGYPRGSAVGAARGMHSGMRSHARAVGTPPQWQRGGRTTAAGVDLSTRSRQIRPGLPVGVIPSTCDSALERECDGSDATEPSDDEDN